MRSFRDVIVALLVLGMSACSTPLPSDIGDYANDCILMTPEPHPPTSGDPHDGFKDVYACGIELAALVALTNTGDPWPEDSMVLKESTKGYQDYPWLIATARKENGKWAWAEYTRNFPDEDFGQILVSEDVCVDCHKDFADTDFIFTRYIP